MQKLIVFYILFHFAMCINAQDKFRIEGNIGIADFIFNRIESEHPDFLNYTTGSRNNDLIDDAHLGFKVTFGFLDTWDASLEMNFLSMVNPLIGDLRFTQYKENLSWNYGLSLIPFEVLSVEPFFESLSEEFIIKTNYYGGHSYYSATNFFAGVYSGINYDLTRGRNQLRLTANAGLAKNKKALRYIGFYKNRSNYIFANKYEIPSRINLWFKPEFRYTFAFINHETYQMGLKLKGTFFLTSKRLNYTRTHYEWTESSGVTEAIVLPRHYHHQLGVEGGLYIKMK